MVDTTLTRQSIWVHLCRYLLLGFWLCIKHLALLILLLLRILYIYIYIHICHLINFITYFSLLWIPSILSPFPPNFTCSLLKPTEFIYCTLELYNLLEHGSPLRNHIPEENLTHPPPSIHQLLKAPQLWGGNMSPSLIQARILAGLSYEGLMIVFFILNPSYDHDCVMESTRTWGFYLLESAENVLFHFNSLYDFLFGLIWRVLFRWDFFYSFENTRVPCILTLSCPPPSLSSWPISLIYTYLFCFVTTKIKQGHLWVCEFEAMCWSLVGSAEETQVRIVILLLLKSIHGQQLGGKWWGSVSLSLPRLVVRRANPVCDSYAGWRTVASLKPVARTSLPFWWSARLWHTSTWPRTFLEIMEWKSCVKA